MNKIYLFNRLRHIIFGEKFYKKLNFDWDVHYDRIQIIQNIINKHFVNLNITHKKLLVLYLSKLVYQLHKYYKFDNFIK